MNLPRSSGILLHPTSLPGPYGIGDLGPEAYKFADFLVDAGQRVWQVLPLGPTGFGDSPYQSFGAFAGNPLLISPERLLDDALVTQGDLAACPDFPADKVDYGPVITWKKVLLAKAYDRFVAGDFGELRRDFERFCHDQAHWLDAFALFMALKDAHDYAPWTQWEPALARYEEEAVAQARRDHSKAFEISRFSQFLFFRQWTALRRYCNDRAIRIVGDIPIYVAHDSVDVWANQEVFQLDEKGDPTVVGGVPPDYFCATGQLWGNPLYRWDYLADTGYAWWIDRVRAVLHMVDIVRIDHFRGFEAYWEVPASHTTAVDGRWVEGPRDGLFDALRGAFGEDLPIIAENLGVITDEVEALRERFGLPGMAVLQFGFGRNAKESSFPPHIFTQNLVAYTGTHDNDTLLGWWKSMRKEKEARAFIRKYLNTTGREFNWVCIRAIMASVADTAVFPLQDVLGLGSEGRMNRPGYGIGNWSWRFEADSLRPEWSERLRDMAETYGRLLD